MTVKHKDNEINFTSTNDSVTSNVSIEMANFWVIFSLYLVNVGSEWNISRHL